MGAQRRSKMTPRVESVKRVSGVRRSVKRATEVGRTTCRRWRRREKRRGTRERESMSQVEVAVAVQSRVAGADAIQLTGTLNSNIELRIEMDPFGSGYRLREQG